MVSNTVYQFVGSNLGVEIFFKKEGTSKKDWGLKLKIEASLYTLYWGFKKIPFTLYTYVLAKILQNGAKFIQKLTPGFKNHMKNLGTFFVQKIHSFSWNIKYRIYLALVSATCVSIHQMTSFIFEVIRLRHHSSEIF